MRKFLAHTDLTNPEKYYAMNDINKLSSDKAQELKCLYGTVKLLDNGNRVFLDLFNKFFFEDGYGNQIYIAKYNKKEKVFDLINSNDFQLCNTFEEFENAIRGYFKRKLK